VEGIEGIEGVQATSSPGFSVLVVEFGLDVDTEQAEDEINDAIAGVSLPEQAAEPEVLRQSASQFPILNVSLSAKDGDLARVTEYAEDEAIPLIEDVEGVASADLVGGSERQIEVDLKPAELEERGIPAEAIVGAISGSNVNAPVGEVSVDGLATPVRTTSELTTVEELRDLPIGAGAPAGAAPTGAPTGAPAGASAPPTASAPPSAASAASPAPAAEAPEPVLLSDVARCGRSTRTSLASPGPTASRAWGSTWSRSLRRTPSRWRTASRRRWRRCGRTSARTRCSWSSTRPRT
jgi:HAE1 family hydrophobic/amphiphilic exporter-1